MIARLEGLLLFIASMIAFSSSLSTLTSNSQILSHEISHECDSADNSINVTEVILDPYPLLRGKQSTATTMGIFITSQILKSVIIEVYFENS